MPAFLRKSLLCVPLLLMAACASRQEPVPNGAPVVSTNAAVFNPAAGQIPLPNILATATAGDPLTGLAAGTPLTPPQALAYINIHEVGGTNAVSGVNAPIYLSFTYPVAPASVNASTIKVFQLTPDAAGTENKPLGFTDISGMFTYQLQPSGTDLLLFPNFPLQPGTRYAYFVTTGVLDAATQSPIIPTAYFQYLQGTTAPTGAAAALAPIWSDVTAGGNILLSGYGKVLTDLVAASATMAKPFVSSRTQVALLGRFITSGAGYVAETAAGTPLVPVEAALRQFAAGAALGGLGAENWSNTIVPTAPATSLTTFTAANPVPALTVGAYWQGVTGAPASSAPASIGSIVLGSINSAMLGLDPVVVAGNPAAMIQAAGAYAKSPAGVTPNASGVTQVYRDAKGNLAGFYNVPTTVPFVYVAPAGTAPKGGWPLVIYQHGITSQKETVLLVSGALTSAGYAVVAIDLPMHGALSLGEKVPANWGQNFMALGSPLATRSNLLQGAFNLHRLEFTAALGGFATLGAAAPAMPTIPMGPLVNLSPSPYHFVGISLGSIVGSIYLAGNASLYPSGSGIPGNAPYLQSTLANDMKGYLSVPGARLAYLIGASPAFGPTINAGLEAVGIMPGTATYYQFMQATQTVVDTADPATMTTPLAAGLPSRLSGRLLMQESTTTTFDASGNPTNGDLVITNPYNRYFANALGGEAVLGSAAAAAIAPNFYQLGYGAKDTIVAQFMYTLSAAGAPIPKSQSAALSLTATAPNEGYFQFATPGIEHGALLDLSTAASQTNAALLQAQMVYFMGATGTSIALDPTALAPAASPSAIPGDLAKVHVAPTWPINGH